MVKLSDNIQWLIGESINNFKFQINILYSLTKYNLSLNEHQSIYLSSYLPWKLLQYEMNVMPLEVKCSLKIYFYQKLSECRELCLVQDTVLSTGLRASDIGYMQFIYYVQIDVVSVSLCVFCLSF